MNQQNVSRQRFSSLYTISFAHTINHSPDEQGQLNVLLQLIPGYTPDCITLETLFAFSQCDNMWWLAGYSVSFEQKYFFFAIEKHIVITLGLVPSQCYVMCVYNMYIMRDITYMETV